jgi:hypothetical protein
VAGAVAAASRAADLGLVVEYRAGESGWRRDVLLACCVERFEDALPVRPFHFEKVLAVSRAGGTSPRCDREWLPLECRTTLLTTFDRRSESGREQAMPELPGYQTWKPHRPPKRPTGQLEWQRELDRVPSNQARPAQKHSAGPIYLSRDNEMEWLISGETSAAIASHAIRATAGQRPGRGSGRLRQDSQRV